MATRLTFVLAAWAGSFFVQTLAPEQKPSVEGVAVDASTGEPLRKAFVKIWKDREPPAQALSGVDGRFRFPVIEPGEYSVHAERPGYLDCDGCMNVRVSTGQSVTGVRIPLTRYGTISGRVVDADGDPWTWGSVVVHRLSWKQGKKQLDSGDALDINDRGEFRAIKLAPGHYFVEADPGRQSPHVPVTYAATFYPAALDPGGAVRIDLHRGQEVSGIEIKLQSAETYRVRGRITGANPLTSSNPTRISGYWDIARLSASFDTVPDSAMPGTRPDGTFEISGIISGTYRLRFGSMIRDGMLMESAQVAETIVEVAGHDVDNVQLVAVAPRRLAGSVRLEGADHPDWTTCLVVLERDEYPKVAQIDKDGSFNFQQMTNGVWRVRVRTPAPNQYFVKSIRAGGAEFPGSMLDTNRLGDSPVEFLLSAKAAQIQGAIQTGSPDLKPDTARTTVLLVPEIDDAGSRESMAMEGTFDQNGGFSIVGIPPGDYKLFAWQDLPEEAWKDADFWNAVKDQGTSLKLAEGDRKSIDLPLISPTETAALLTRLDIQ